MLVWETVWQPGQVNNNLGINLAGCNIERGLGRCLMTILPQHETQWALFRCRIRPTPPGQVVFNSGDKLNFPQRCGFWICVVTYCSLTGNTWMCLITNHLCPSLISHSHSHSLDWNYISVFASKPVLWINTNNLSRITYILADFKKKIIKCLFWKVKPLERF